LTGVFILQFLQAPLIHEIKQHATDTFMNGISEGKIPICQFKKYENVPGTSLVLDMKTEIPGQYTFCRHIDLGLLP
jgi:hypothetical protein